MRRLCPAQNACKWSSSSLDFFDRFENHMTKLQKATSAYYGEPYQHTMLTYHAQSKMPDSYEHRRVKLGDELVNNYVRSVLENRPKETIKLADIGCSVGTFAIHFSKQGYKVIGIDFDRAAITLAQKLNAEEGGSATFFQMDVAALKNEIDKLDIAVCMDLFEHLHDDELGALLYSLKNLLSENGCVVFHTLPLQFDYIFWKNKKGKIAFPFLLQPFKSLSPRTFSKLTRIYALLIDIGMVCWFGKTHTEHIKRFEHCNPLTQERLADMFERAGYELRLLRSGFVTDQFDQKYKKYFQGQPITHRSLFGVAVPCRPTANPAPAT
jgi:2-polyprenyl-3-methyl-5-hydroxy-6-metoxy-1,4-benzoquinol methylase